MRLAISTGGGDAPGLNAVIRAAVLSALYRGWEVLGICRGYYGLLGEDEIIPLTRQSVRGIAHMGGTILRTTNRGNPFEFPVQQPDGQYKMVDRSDEVLKNARELGIDHKITVADATEGARCYLDPASAGVAQWQSPCFPSKLRGFDSRHPLQISTPRQLGAWTPWPAL